MLGAIAGDVIGSIFEFNNNRSKNFPLFSDSSGPTDDSILTFALAESILTGTSYIDLLHQFYRLYPGGGYGGRFHKWATNKVRTPYNSCGNGSAMRVSPVAYAYNDLDTVLAKAKESADVTHNHPEGVKGAQSVAAAIFLARTGKSKAEIKEYIVKNFGYNLDRKVDDIRPTYEFNETCQGSVPEAFCAFLEGKNYEDTVRTAISIGGDSDTIACIAGGIAEAFYGGVPKDIVAGTISRMDHRMKDIYARFKAKYLNQKTAAA